MLCQKFLGVFLVKFLLSGKLPTVRDQSFLLLLGIHLSTFFYFHSKHGKGFMNRLMKSDTRLVIQETFKGYGKGISLLSSINKGFKLETNLIYFIFVIIVRCSASSTAKAIFLSKLIKRKKKPIKFNKTKINFVFNSIPTIIVYLVIVALRYHLTKEVTSSLEQTVTNFFVIFMTMSRFVRSLCKILKLQQRKTKRKIKREKL